MVNGKEGDHPLIDIVTYGLPVFSPDVDAMVREVCELGGFRDEISAAFLMDQQILVKVARGEYGPEVLDLLTKEENVLRGLRNTLGSELRRLRREHSCLREPSLR